MTRNRHADVWEEAARVEDKTQGPSEVRAYQMRAINATCLVRWRRLGTVARIEERLGRNLDGRRLEGRLRILEASGDVGQLVDFASNDYLGLARDTSLHRAALESELERCSWSDRQLNGSTGSRLLTGSSAAHQDLERWLAAFHGREAALAFGSGYAANAGTIACLPSTNDAVIFDELSHNSTRFGMGRGRQRWTRPFRHNDVDDLRRALRSAEADMAFVCVESVYSMDGDAAPLAAMADVCAQERGCLVVDEAHATGVLGRGGRGAVADLADSGVVLCTIHTFGKAVGCHGAAVLGSATLRDYLANYAQPFVYSTACGSHSPGGVERPPAGSHPQPHVSHGLMSWPLTRLRRFLRRCYEALAGPIGDERRSSLGVVVSELRRRLASVAAAHHDITLIESGSPIHALVVPGAKRALAVAADARSAGFDVGAIRAPTVRAGSERLRIVAHAHNTLDDVAGLCGALDESLARQAAAPGLSASVVRWPG